MIYWPSGLMPVVVPDHSGLNGKKRRRSATEDEQPAASKRSIEPPWKRAKRPFLSQQEATAAFWDSLSTQWLTRGALKELNRRNRSPADPPVPAPKGQLDLVLDSALQSCSGQIKRFARHGGPDLRDLRGYSECTTNSTARAMTSSQSSSRSRSKSRDALGKSTSKSSTRKSSAYRRDFEQHLVDHGIYPYNRGEKPRNWDKIQQKIAQPRPSLSPSKFSDGAFEAFQQANEDALTEAMVMRKPFPMISGDADIPSAGELSFGNLEPLTDGTLVDAKPDYYDGARPAQIDRRVREVLSPYIIPSTQQQAPALPNFFTEGKGPDGSGAVAKRQACYNGALGARGMHKIRSFEAADSDSAYDNNAYTITSSYHNGHLQVYTTHPTQSPDTAESPVYQMTQLRSFAMTDTPESFREGASAFRNARDWAKEQRDEFITAANSRIIDNPNEASTQGSSGCGRLSPSTEPILPDSETSADELTLDVDASVSPSHKRRR